jgi:hypothetical protein
MRSKMLSAVIKVAVIAGTLLTAGVSSAAAVDVYLQAQAFDKNIPDGMGGMIPVRMWGFTSCDSSWVCASVDAPGPRINVTDADSLTIHLTNTLNVPVSIIIPGLAGGGDPVALPSDTRRARSLTHETGTGTPVTPSAEATYVWSSLRAGTYLYQSGTAPSLEVSMGLYGALIVTPATPVACTADPLQTLAYAVDVEENSCRHSDEVLLFSEVDPVQNQRVDDAASDGFALAADCVPVAEYVDPIMTPGYPCSVDYFPALTLVNGQPTADTTSMITAGDRILLRFINAGQRTHVPAIVGVEMNLIAEDGNLYPGLPRQQNEASLPAGKTLDAWIDTTGTADITYAIFDRGPAYTNENQPTGGSIGGVVVGMGTMPPGPASIYALDDVYPMVPEDASPYISTMSVLDNDVGLTSPTASLNTDVSHGTLVFMSDGNFTYEPEGDFSGTDTFTYSAIDGTGTYPAQVTLNVTFVNDAPVANDDGPIVNAIGGDIHVDAPGVLANDSDADGDALTAAIFGPTPAGLTLNTDGSFDYVGGTPGATVTFQYTASDGTVASLAPATVTLKINPVANITLDVHDPTPTSVTSYRWIVQEDATFHLDPLAPPDPADQMSTNFHTSYIPVVAQGCVGAECATDNDAVPVAAFNLVALDPTKFYYVSVLPNDVSPEGGHALGGAQILPGTANDTVEVIVNNQPIPTAQISVVVFEDIQPTNGVPDPGEPGLLGAEIQLEDAAGRYGQAPGFLSQDAFGEPLWNVLGDPSGADCFAGAPPPTGVILTCPDGTALIQNLPPGKYGVIITPPATDDMGNEVTWTQTSTIEGTNVQDTWVKAGEPPFLVEFGAPGYHAFIGFVSPDRIADEFPAPGPYSVSGRVTMAHTARAPDNAVYDSGSYDTPLPHTRAWVGVNSGAGGGPNIATVQAEPNGDFTLPNIPDGTHQLVIWDEYLDTIIYYQTVIVSGGPVDVGNIPVPTWFGRHEHTVFLDVNENGMRDDPDLEPGMPDQNINLRFRDGTIFQSFPTDLTGFVPFDQIFPFGAWQVAEVDFLRHRATGVRIWVDGGGDVSGGPFPGLMNPQTGTPRTEDGPEPVLLEGFQSMPGMTSIFEWGKKPYARGENGGIAGIVFYGSTRGENDPRLTVGDTWEPGIPHVTVRLYREIETMGGGTALALVGETQTDSWDDNLPTDCEGESATDPFVTDTLNGDRTRCFDGVRNFEQVRNGVVFDGGYAFDDIPPGAYVVEVVPPPGYEIIKEEDKNVDFGDAFEMAPVPMMMASAFLVTLPDAAMVAEAQMKDWGIVQPPCVGEDHMVPATLSLFPGEVDTYAPYSGAMRPLCDRKSVILSDQSAAAADFHLFTSTPIAGQIQGLTTDDVAVETNPASPQMGDKWGPAYLPIVMRDFNGHEVYRMYTDGFGHYNGVVPSTFTANAPIPSGYSPAMHQVCLNDPGSGPTPDPLHNPNYGTFCYTLMYMPGTTTYLDTPILPLAAFAAGYNPVDCALPDGTPVITQVNVQGGGDSPWTDVTDGSRDLVIHGQGNTLVPNPAYEGPLASPPYDEPTIQRSYGFGGSQGSGSVTWNGTPLSIVQWNQNQIRADVPSCGSPSCTGQLVVTRDNGKKTINTVTFTVSTETPIRVPDDEPTIQDAIDAADPGALILVRPGEYDELVVMWKPVRLQGAGPLTVINAVKNPPEKLDAWRQKIRDIIDAGDVDLLPGQPTEFDLVGVGLLGNELGAAITVLAKDDGSFGMHPSRIDGFTITGADGGGGIFVNGYADSLVISNNHVTGNSGVLHGGIRIGHPNLPSAGNHDDGVGIHHNSITLNGAQADQGVAGGLALCTGTDSYTVSHNYICGNFSMSNAGGVGHYGLSDDGLIEFNQILFNQTFNQGLGKSGGGLFIGGEPPAAGPLTPGAGDVIVNANLIQGNQAGSGHGGGARLQAVNGTDATGTPWSLTFTNNMVVNNVAGWSGGGLSLQDTTNVTIVNNTVANNDSTATVGALVVGNVSTAQPAGISAERHSLALAAALGDPNGFSDPTLFNNIVWHNRSFTYDATVGSAHLLPVVNQTAVGECGSGANYWDLGVLGEPLMSPALKLSPSYSILTSTTEYGGANNVSGDPAFVSEYCNGARTLSTPGPMQVAAEVIEGGNFIDVRYGPLSTAWPDGSPPWDYHVFASSAGHNNGNGTGAPSHDFDDEMRPQGGTVDRGADESEVAVLGTVAFTSASPYPLNGAMDTLAFGNQPNNADVSSTVTLTVSGSAVTFGTLTVTGSNTFGIGGTDTCSNAMVNAGSTCLVEVTFSGQGGGEKSATLTVPHDGAGSPLTLAITGQ